MAMVIVIAPPARFRAYVAIYCTALAGFLVLFATEGLLHGARASLVAFGPLVGLGAVAGRAGRLSAEAREEALTVRNWLQTRRLDRSSIRGFRIGGSSVGSGRNAIQVLSADGASLPISASISPWYLITAAQQAQWLTALEDWRKGNPPALQHD